MKKGYGIFVVLMILMGMSSINAFEVDNDPIITLLNFEKDVSVVLNNYDKGIYFDRWDQTILGDPFTTKAKTRVKNTLYDIYIIHQKFIEVSTIIDDKDRNIFLHLAGGLVLVGDEVFNNGNNQLSAIFSEHNSLILIEHNPTQKHTLIVYRMNF